MFLIKSWKNNIYLRNSNEMFQKQCGNRLSSLLQWFYHEFSGNGFKRPEDRSQKTEEIANLKFIPTNEERFE